MKPNLFFLFSSLFIFLLNCDVLKKDKNDNLLINLLVMYNDGVFNPRENFCRNVNNTIPNGQVVNVSVGQGVKKIPGANGTDLEIVIQDSSGCKVRFELYYCDVFNNTLYLFDAPPDPGTCANNDFSYIEGPSGNQLNCSINRSNYYKYAIQTYSVDSTGTIPTACNYTIKVTDF